ncbi:hypothetical protein EVAR_11330_1 [Eumeta japonica]|uniref:Uncharacterized protein n=1 Tax=Eumeta variegata TaxID=151549 RepID=A0A4C1U125_EUMVA|nr:hypothetical protein EVAR_11330_1 [Eumeta japonica]
MKPGSELIPAPAPAAGCRGLATATANAYAWKIGLQPSYCETRLNKEVVKSERKRCPSFENTTPQEIRSPEACTREEQPEARAYAAIA